MFEDSTFESAGRIRTRSRAWMFAALGCNGTILLGMVLVPLLYPEALTRMGALYMMEAPLPPPAASPRPVQRQSVHGPSQMPDGQFVAPRRVPLLIAMFKPGEDVAPSGELGIEGGSGAPNGADEYFTRNRVVPHVQPEAKAPIRVPSSVVAGLLIRKTLPVYPPIARAAHVEGTVVLQAAISAAGSIQNLRVVSGPAMLRQAALDAVRDWRYRPYELNGEPVEVETTVNVIFALSR
jgi:protein TonB